MSGRQVDIGEICRLCLLDQNDFLKSVFDETLSSNSLPQKIALLLQIQISKHDKLSTMVCNDCIIRLDTWFAYKRQCHRNQNKLAEWLNISKAGVTEFNETVVHIKQEPIDPLPAGLVQVKVEMNCEEEEEFNDINMGAYPPQEESQHIYLEDLDINALETDDDRRCSDCGKMFGSVQNRRRHQNMMHAKKERRAQMMEIRKSSDGGQSQPQVANQSQKEEYRSEIIKLEPNDSGTTTNNAMDTTPDATLKDEKESASESPVINNDEKISDEADKPTNESVSSSEKTADMDTNTDSLAADSETITKPNLEDQPPAEISSGEDQKPSSENGEKTSASTEEVKSEEKVDDKPTESNTQVDEKKIEFAAGLRLLQKDSAPIELESLSKIELSYIEKCKAMVSMFHTLQCACHNVQHKTLRYLLSHLRETRIWFPLFTCYNCMISLTDRSTFTRHHSRCPRPQLETLIKLSNVKKRSEVKPRLYQNFKCNRCKFLFSFHDDFCKHIDEDHAYGAPPFYCSCRYVFDSLDEYKTHCYTSCILSYYCDICFITTSTLEEFVKHAQELHDNSEGFVLLQENLYIPRNQTFRHKEADDKSNVVEGKRERRRSAKEPIMVQIYDREIPPDLKEIPTRIIKKMIQLDSVPTTADGWNRTPACCPLCKKQYSSVNNMMRHYRTHIERKEVEIPKLDDETGNVNEDLYTCPDCGGVYPSSKWSKHLEEKHPAKICSECDKEFKFQSELDQHRSVHLNIKVFRDSKTQAYRSAMVSPAPDSESNGLPGDVLVMCEICDDTFKSREELINHKLIQHDSASNSDAENHDISVDDEQLSTLDPLDATEDSNFANETTTSQSSPAELPFCEPCNKPFASAKSLREHVINKHGAEFLKKSEYPKKCQYCSKMCSSGAGYRIHMQMHERMNPADKNKDDEFPKKCEYCDKMCTSGAGYYLHTQMHERVTLGDMKKKKDDKKKIDLIKKEEEEDESYHTCKRCFKVFGTKGKLREHMKCHGMSFKSAPKKSRKVLCNLCHIALDSNEALRKHKSEEHGDELDGMPTLINEMDVDEDSKGTNFTSDSAPAIIYACDICEDTFSSKPELRTHKEVHSKPKTKNYVCKYCRIPFDSVSELTKHMHVEHEESAKPKITKETKTKPKDNPEKSFKCPTCRKGFASHGAMTTHSGWHKRNKNRDSAEPIENTPKATAAAKKAKKDKMLRKIAEAAVCKQEPIETPEFQCSTCYLELPNETALQIHVLERHGNLDAYMLIPRCNTCNQDFSSQEEYDTHKRFHDFLERQKKHEKQLAQQQIKTPIIQSVQSVVEPAQTTSKKFPCSWCNSIFSRHDTLNTHIKNHHKEHVKTEFQCNQCNRVFDKQNSLTIHLKVHQKQRNAAAVAAASAAAAQASNSSYNVSIGNTGKIYVCSLCNVSFNFPKDLRMHTINAHPF